VHGILRGVRTSTWVIGACTTAAVGACGTAIVLRLASDPGEQARRRRARAVVEAAAEERPPSRPDPGSAVTRDVEEATFRRHEAEDAAEAEPSPRRARRARVSEAEEETPAPRSADRGPTTAGADVAPRRALPRAADDSATELARPRRPLPPLPTEDTEDDDVDPRRSPRREHASSTAPGVAAPIRGREHRPAASERPDDERSLFQLTYYDFPTERRGPRDAVLYDARCAPIADVTQAFHDQVCVQGSGRLASGATVSFARRDCECASACPRTGQHICFEKLDRESFPHGRGAMGRAITPLYTVAVDASVIPLGTSVFIPELMGLPREDGSPHDGCFIAEDRGLRVVGHKVDVFTGDAATTATWSGRLAPSHGVHVLLRDPRCSGARD